MKATEIVDIIDGLAKFEYMGDLFEYIGREGEKYIFQSVNDDSYIRTTLKSLAAMPEYSIRY